MQSCTLLPLETSPERMPSRRSGVYRKRTGGKGRIKVRSRHHFQTVSLILVSWVELLDDPEIDIIYNPVRLGFSFQLPMVCTDVLLNHDRSFRTVFTTNGP